MAKEESLRFFKDLAKKIIYTIPSDAASEMTRLEKLITKQISKRKSAYSSLRHREVLSGVDEENRTSKDNDGKRAKVFRLKKHREAYNNINAELAQNAKDFKELYNFFLYDVNRVEIITKMKKCFTEIEKAEKVTSTKSLELPALELANEASKKTRKMLSNAKFINKKFDFAKSAILTNYAQYIDLLKRKLEKTEILRAFREFKDIMKEVAERCNKENLLQEPDIIRGKSDYKEIKDLRKECDKTLKTVNKISSKASKDRILGADFDKIKMDLSSAISKFDSYIGKMKAALAVLEYGEIFDLKFDDIELQFNTSGLDEVNRIELNNSVARVVSATSEAIKILKESARKVVKSIAGAEETDKIYENGSMWGMAYNGMSNQIKLLNEKKEKIKLIKENFSKTRYKDQEAAVNFIKSSRIAFDRFSWNDVRSALGDFNKWANSYHRRHSFMGRTRRVASYAGLAMGLLEKLGNLALSVL